MSESPVSFTRRGVHPVGVATLEVSLPESEDRSVLTDVWYPSHTGDLDAARAEHPFGRPHDAVPEVPPQDGPFPLVVFSHGNSGLRRQSTFLTTHLASWGLVVAAPDHSGNTFYEMSRIEGEEERRRIHFEARRNRPRDLEAVAGRLLEGDSRWPRLTQERFGALGHSYGGWTALKMPGRDARVGAVCGLAPASEPFVGRRAFEPDELPFAEAIPTLLVAGADDVLIDLESSVLPLFERLAAPRALLSVEQIDHFHFCDGVELLHTLHEKNPRSNQPRPTRPYGELLTEARVHRILCGLVAHFFTGALVKKTDPCRALGRSMLSDLDPAIRRLAAIAEGEAA